MRAGERDRLAGEAVGIAAAVPPLVRRADDRADRRAARERRRGCARRSGCAGGRTPTPSSSSGPGLWRMASGIASLPTSCSSAARRSSSRSRRRAQLPRRSRRELGDIARRASRRPGSRSASACEQQLASRAPAARDRRASARRGARRRGAAPRWAARLRGDVTAPYDGVTAKPSPPRQRVRPRAALDVALARRRR